MSNIVTFEQAKNLKKLGFDVPTKIYLTEIYHYHSVNRGVVRNHNESDCAYSTPDVHTALQWIREKFGAYCGIIPYMWNYRGKVIFQGKLNLSCPNEIMTDNYESYDLAESALLDEILTCLEEIV